MYSFIDKLENEFALIVFGNLDISRDISAIQKRFGLPLDYKNVDQNKFANDLFFSGDNAMKEIDGLMRKYKLSRKFRSYLHCYVRYNVTPAKGAYFVFFDTPEHHLPFRVYEDSVVIQIYRGMTINDLKSFWPIVKYLVNRESSARSREKNSKYAIADIAVYQQHLLGKSSKEIMKFVQQKQNRDLDYNDVRKIVRKFKTKSKKLVAK